MDEKGGNDGFLPLSGILASLADRTRPCFGRTRLHPGGKEGQKGGTAKTQMGQKEQQVDRPQILEQQHDAIGTSGTRQIVALRTRERERTSRIERVLGSAKLWFPCCKVLASYGNCV